MAEGNDSQQFDMNEMQKEMTKQNTLSQDVSVTQLESVKKPTLGGPPLYE